MHNQIATYFKPFLWTLKANSTSNFESIIIDLCQIFINITGAHLLALLKSLSKLHYILRVGYMKQPFTSTIVNKAIMQTFIDCVWCRSLSGVHQILSRASADYPIINITTSLTSEISSKSFTFLAVFRSRIFGYEAKHV